MNRNASRIDWRFRCCIVSCVVCVICLIGATTALASGTTAPEDVRSEIQQLEAMLNGSSPPPNLLEERQTGLLDRLRMFVAVNFRKGDLQKYGECYSAARSLTSEATTLLSAARRFLDAGDADTAAKYVARCRECMNRSRTYDQAAMEAWVGHLTDLSDTLYGAAKVSVDVAKLSGKTLKLLPGGAVVGQVFDKGALALDFWVDWTYKDADTAYRGLATSAVDSAFDEMYAQVLVSQGLLQDFSPVLSPEDAVDFSRSTLSMLGLNIPGLEAFWETEPDLSCSDMCKLVRILTAGQTEGEAQKTIAELQAKTGLQESDIARLRDALAQAKCGKTAAGGESSASTVSGKTAGATGAKASNAVATDGQSTDKTRESSSDHSGGSPITFKDAGFERAIRQALGRSSGDILDTDLKRIHDLRIYGAYACANPSSEENVDLSAFNASGNGYRDRNGVWHKEKGDVRSLDDLRFLPNLSQLEVCYQNQLDIGGLAYCPRLYVVYLQGDEITELSPLSSLTNLITFRVANQDKPIGDLSPLKGLSKLTSLTMAHCCLHDVSALSGLKRLKHLYLYGNSIVDVGALSGLSAVQDLDLSMNSISDASSLRGLSSIHNLHLGQNRIADITPVAGLTNLTELGLYGNPIADLGPVSALAKLEILYLGSTGISDLTPLRGLKQLKYLDLRDNRVFDVSPLKDLTGLETLDLSGNSIADYSPLARLVDTEVIK